MITSLLFTLAALASAPSSDSAFAGFHAPSNPSQGALGTWSYGYFEPGDTFTLLPNLVPYTAAKLNHWQIQTSVGGGVPRITQNFGTVDKVVTAVLFPASDYLVMKPRNSNAAVLRFTADSAATYAFDTTFRSMRVTNGASTLVSMEQAGVAVGACAAPVVGLNADIGAVLECSGVVLELEAGDSVDFVVDANGIQAYDDIGVKVDVAILAGDTDSDGLDDLDEVALGTDPADPDSDDDGLSDGDEVNLHATDPLDPDSDVDGLTDGEEVDTYSTDPLDDDSDDDILFDGEEVITYNSDPNDDDSDGDTLIDGDEVLTYATDPNSNDSDSDSLHDDLEINVLGTDPNSSDSDSDGLSDPDELMLNTDPNDSDSDVDGLSDGDEILVWSTDPLVADTDGDGVSDGDEVDAGSDPLVPGDALPGDDLEEAFTSFNPSTGGLGEWFYGTHEPGDVFAPFAVYLDNGTLKLETWQYIPGGTAVPRITNNYNNLNKTWSSVTYSAEDEVVLRPKSDRPAVVRFTADADGNYLFETLFHSARNVRGVTTLVSVEQNGAVVGTCAGSVVGTVNTLGSELACDASVTLLSGESVEFVVEANGTDVNDEVALSVVVYGETDPVGDLTCADDVISAVPTTINGSTVGQGNDGESNCGGEEGPDRLYAFTAPATGLYTFDTLGSAYDTMLYVLDSCGGAELACNDDNIDLESLVQVNLVAGQSVIVGVDGFSNNEGSFVLNVY